MWRTLTWRQVAKVAPVGMERHHQQSRRKPPQQPKVFRREDMAKFKKDTGRSSTMTVDVNVDEMATVKFSSSNFNKLNGGSGGGTKQDFSRPDVKYGGNSVPRPAPSATRNSLTNSADTTSRHHKMQTKLRKYVFPNCNLLPPYRGKIVEYIDPVKASQFAVEWWKKGEVEAWAREETKLHQQVKDMSVVQSENTVSALDDILNEMELLPIVADDAIGQKESSSEKKNEKAERKEKERQKQVAVHSERLAGLLGPPQPGSHHHPQHSISKPEGNKLNYFERQVKEILVSNHDTLSEIKDLLASNKKLARKEDLYRIPAMVRLWTKLRTKVLLPLVELFGFPLTMGELQDLTNLPRSYLRTHLLQILDGVKGFGAETVQVKSSSAKLMVIEITENHLKDKIELLVVSKSRKFFQRAILPYVPASMPVPLNVLWRCTQWDRTVIAGLEIHKQVALQGAKPTPLGTLGSDLSCFLLYLFEFVKSGDLQVNLKKGLVQRADMTRMCPVEQFAWAVKFSTTGPKYCAMLEQGPIEELRIAREIKNQRFKDRATAQVNQRPRRA